MLFLCAPDRKIARGLSLHTFAVSVHNFSSANSIVIYINDFWTVKLSVVKHWNLQHRVSVSVLTNRGPFLTPVAILQTLSLAFWRPTISLHQFFINSAFQFHTAHRIYVEPRADIRPLLQYSTCFWKRIKWFLLLWASVLEEMQTCWDS